jgi:tetratricopeptide (TPR) repeat protein
VIRTLLLLALVAQPPVQRSVEQIAAEAEAAFEAKHYDEAAAAFADAFARQPHPGYLYARAQAERFGGHCREAIDHYREFIALAPGEGPVRDAQRNIDRCEEKLALEQPAPEPEPPPASPPPPAAETTPARDPVDAAPRPRPWYRDPWGGVLTATGVAALAIGGGLYGRAVNDEKAARTADDVIVYADKIERASTLSRAGIAMFAVGGALTLAGIIRWAVVGARNRRSSRTAVTFELHF